VRLLRLLGLLAVIAAACFAVYLFHQRTLSGFFPVWLLEAVPVLNRIARWLPADLLQLALWLSLFAAIGFGLIAPSWRGEQVMTLRPPLPIGRGRRVAGRGLMALALGGASAAGMVMLFNARDGWQVQALWATAVLVYLLGAGLAALLPSASSDDPYEPGPVRPERSWPLVLLILVVATFLVLYPIWNNPVRIEPEVAQFGLRALTLVNGETPLFTTDTPVTPFALTLLALTFASGISPLLGLQISGIVAGLLTVLGLWLLGCELFRRTPHKGVYHESLADAGQWPALIASGILLASPVLLHFSRLPVYLEPVAWGVLGLWALLRGLRIGDTLAVALSGVLLGLAMLLYPSGLIFAPVAISWWLGVWLLQPGWLRPQSTLSGRSWLGPIWLGGLVTTLLPQLVLWVQVPAAFTNRFAGLLLPNPSDLLVLVNIDAYRDVPLAFPTTGVALFLAPIVILALGNLLLNLDRLTGWALFTWSLVALILGNGLAPQPHFWPVFLPLLPALALTLAFTLDRIRATLLATAGTWTTQATTYLAIGLVLWVVLLGWIEDQEYLQTTGDPVTATAVLLQSLPSERTPLLLLGERRAEINWETPLVQLLTGRLPIAKQTVAPEAWPETLPARSTIVIQPEDQALLPELQSRYPGGQLTLQRDRWGNPLLFVYELP
jgi:hypothetical protein